VRRTGAAWLTAAVLAGCGGSTSSSPSPVTLAELVEDQQGFDGDLVTVEGTVRSYDAPLHHWIEDADQHRVELEPQELVAPHVGDRVRVAGRYTFRDDRGRLIEIDDLEVLEVGSDESA
jgi:hypothetical protein